MKYVIPVIVVAVIVVAAIKKVKPYDAFCDGVKKAFPLVIKIFPYILTVLVMCEVFEKSGLSKLVIGWLSPVFGAFGIPEEMIGLVLVKPFSGSGSLAVLNDLLVKHGADSYVGRCAAVVYGSSETVFYVGAVYFSTCKKRSFALPVIISLAATFISTVFAVFICRII